MMEKRRQNIPFIEGIFHVLFWALVIHYFFDIEGLGHSFSDFFINKDTAIFDEAFLILPISIALFYWNLFFLIPQYLNKTKWIWYCIGLLLSYIFGCYILITLCDYLVEKGVFFRIPAEDVSNLSVELFLQILIASTALGVSKIAFRNLALKRLAEQKQKEAELKYLANQFNPHFLYNTLNGLYAKAIEENASETAEAIVRLSEIMRFPIKQGLKQEVPLAEEVQFIEDYIALQRLRLGSEYPIHFEKEEQLEGINILPLSLIVLVENSFKFGVSPQKQSPITFRLRLREDHLHFTSENQVKTELKSSSHNIGLDNLRKRLELSYGKNFTLQTEEKTHTYLVNLKLRLDKPRERKE